MRFELTSSSNQGGSNWFELKLSSKHNLILMILLVLGVLLPRQGGGSYHEKIDF